MLRRAADDVTTGLGGDAVPGAAATLAAATAAEATDEPAPRPRPGTGPGLGPRLRGMPMTGTPPPLKLNDPPRANVFGAPATKE
mmetsp:Transcript_41721/g.104844  ORF Transcript_41721/g.104844 Transcript_41721/m.104844 type:complete len:84 (-) Transcript_41721:717-968(-)